MIDLNEESTVSELQKLPFWNPEEMLLNSEPAGESNMNLVLRIKTNQRNLILKQSKPYVRKYPQIPAPIERIAVEYAFFKIIEKDSVLIDQAPKVLHFDRKEHILITADLGKSADFSRIYSGEKALKEAEIKELTVFLNRLHNFKVEDFPENMEMRKLNHEHLFGFPFLEENGFDLDQIQEGLQEISLNYKRDQELKSKLELLGKRYLGSGSALIHGDFYPGSWLDTATGIKIIDPEFGFLGDREFDLGVFLAHLDLGQQTEEIKSTVLETYTIPVDFQLVNQYRGMEILRRLIGIAQLPLNLSLSQKGELMKTAKNLILN
jgi:5-methylthioribose kinase